MELEDISMDADMNTAMPQTSLADKSLQPATSGEKDVENRIATENESDACVIESSNGKLGAGEEEKETEVCADSIAAIAENYSRSDSEDCSTKREELAPNNSSMVQSDCYTVEKSNSCTCVDTEDCMAPICVSTTKEELKSSDKQDNNWHALPVNQSLPQITDVADCEYDGTTSIKIEEGMDEEVLATNNVDVKLENIHNTLGEKADDNTQSAEPVEMLMDGQAYVMKIIDKELDSIRAISQMKPEDDSPSVEVSESAVAESSSSSDSSSDLESSSSESSESSSEDDLEDIRKEIEKEEEQVIIAGPPRVKGELLVKDLPEVPDLDITLDDETELVELGQVFGVVESLVVVKALPQTPALDADSVIFLDNRSCLGLVFETFGPVQTPYYSIRFNKEEDIAQKNVHPGDKVFFAPDMIEYSKFVFMVQLKRLKGSDASWKNDEEPPQEFVEYSDDEEESKAKSVKKKERMAKRCPSVNDDKTGPMESSETQPNQGQNRVVPGGRKRTWQGQGRGQQVNPNQSQGGPGPDTSHPPLHPAFRGPAPWTGALPTQRPELRMGRPERPCYPMDQRFPPHVGFPPRGPPVRGPGFMVPQSRPPPPCMVPNQGHFPRTRVPRPPFDPGSLFMGGRGHHVQWPPGPPPGHEPRLLMHVPRSPFLGDPVGNMGFHPRGLGNMGLLPPPPPPPPQ